MKIGILGAMLEEIAYLHTRMENTITETIGQRQFHSGRLNNQDIVLVFSRWGKVAASSTVTTLIDRFNVDFVIFTGIAGAIDKDLEPGDFVIADKLIQHDMDVSQIGGMAKFEIPLLGKKYFEVQSDYVQLAVRAAHEYIEDELTNDIGIDILNDFGIISPKVIQGTIASGDQFVADTSVSDYLRSSIDNLKCVEMEGAAIAQVAWEHNKPFVVIRTISDKADHTAHIDFPKFVNNIASHLTSGVVLKLLKILQ